MNIYTYILVLYDTSFLKDIAHTLTLVCRGFGIFVGICAFPNGIADWAIRPRSVDGAPHRG